MSVETSKAAAATILRDDSTYSALMAGGIHSNVTEISRQDTPAAFNDKSELLTCTLVRIETTNPTGPYDHSAHTYLLLYIYSRGGPSVVGTAIDLAYMLLHRQCLASAWDCRQVFENRDLEDIALNCDAGLIRFRITVNRAS